MSDPIVYRHRFEITLRHTDAAGVLFYPRLFELAHEATEMLLVEIGYPISEMVAGRLHHLPIVHADAEYRLPMRLGDRLVIEVSLHKLGDRSLGFTCTFVDPEGRTRAITRVDHAAIDPLTRKVCDLDPGMKAALGATGG